MEKIKTIVKKDIRCPHCKKYIEVKHTKTTITKPVSGEYKDEIKVDKTTQTRLKK